MIWQGRRVHPARTAANPAVKVFPSPSPALGWAGGGDIPISKQDPNGQRAAEPFFEVRANVDAPKDIVLMHGRAGMIRFDLEPEPLLPRVVRRVRQLLQKRYQI